MFGTFAIALAMSTDAFAASLGMGAALHRPRLIQALRTGAVFGAVEAVTPVIGWAIGLAASAYIAAVDHWIAFALLGTIGLKMIYESVTRPADRPRRTRHGLLALAVTAVATSLDALAVGVSLAILDADIVVTAVAIGFATFTMTSSGIMLGRAVGEKGGRYAEAIGGIVLIAVGINILGEHLGAWTTF